MRYETKHDFYKITQVSTNKIYACFLRPLKQIIIV